MKEKPSVRVQHLQKDFGQVRALRDVSLKIERGQIYGLLGPNGAGKTTLIRVLVGSAAPTSGNISVLGFDPNREKSALRRLIGYMPQSPALYDDLSARDNIVFFGGAHKSPDLSERVEEVIEFVRLSGRSNDPVYTFSGGMKQRVSLACALVHQPQLLFLDEPTSGIDPQLRAAFWEHFRELASKGVTIMISTHQMDEALYCDRLAILHQGALLADATPQQLQWNSQARIRIWRGETVDEFTMKNHPESLPRTLMDYGLDPTISRIDIEEDTLEAVVLQMIKGHERTAAEDDSNA